MPILIDSDNDLDDLLQRSWTACRKVVTVGGEANTDGWELGVHSHAKAQLLLALSGVVTCEVETGIWLVPPGSALFIAGGMSHRLAIAGEVRSYVTLIRADVLNVLPASCCTLQVSPLLRELILKSAEFSMDGEQSAMEVQVSELLLGEIAAAKTGEIHLPMPSDPRLRAIFTSIMANPAGGWLASVSVRLND